MLFRYHAFKLRVSPQQISCMNLISVSGRSIHIYILAPKFLAMGRLLTKKGNIDRFIYIYLHGEY